MKKSRQNSKDLKSEQEKLYLMRAHIEYHLEEQRKWKEFTETSMERMNEAPSTIL